jgi:hypothetical protein
MAAVAKKSPGFVGNSMISHFIQFFIISIVD